MGPRNPEPGLIPLGRLKRRTGEPAKGQSLVGTSPQVASKCDLCRDYEAPACVQACPTGSLIRLDPKQAFTEVAALLATHQPGQHPPATRSSRWLNLATLAIIVIAITCAGVAATARTRDLIEPGTGIGLWMGAVAAILMLMLVGHSLPKRMTRLWMRRRSPSARTAGTKPVRSRLRFFLLIHLFLGLLLPGAVLAHAGSHLSGTISGLLHVATWLVIGLGIAGALTYRLIPSALAKLERRGDLPEDLPERRQFLLDRMQRELSGRSVELKRVARAILLPYAHTSLGWLQLLASTRSLREEQSRLKQHVYSLFEPQLHARLAGLDDIVRTVVDLRALPARRLLTFCLRAWLIPHILVSALTLVLLSLHILGMRDYLAGGLP